MKKKIVILGLARQGVALARYLAQTGAQVVISDMQPAEKLAAQTLDPFAMTPQQFATRLKSDYDKYARLMRETGAKLD